MGQAELVIAGLLVAVVGLSALARRLSIPYPIVLVVGGALCGFIPGQPVVRLNPQVVLVVFLPLFYGQSIYMRRLSAPKSVLGPAPIRKPRPGPPTADLAGEGVATPTPVLNVGPGARRVRALSG